MKSLKINVALLLTIFLTFVSCKNEPKKISEKQLVQTLKKEASIAVKKETFVKNIYPLIDSLYKADSVKYNMIHHISQKAAKEKNNDVFNHNYKDLKAEIELLQINKK